VRTVLRILAVAFIVFVGMLPTSSAQAASGKYALIKTWDKGVPGCVGVKLHGRMAATKDFYISGAGHLVHRKRNPRLINPSIQVNVRTKCGGSKKRASRLQVKQYWHYSACSANPSVSVSAPFSVGVSATPTCGKKRVGFRETNHGRGHTYEQNVVGKAAQWKKTVDWADGVPELKLCVRGSADVTVHFGSKSYSKRIDMGRACV
jgi:hypothetical protein